MPSKDVGDLDRVDGRGRTRGCGAGRRSGRRRRRGSWSRPAPCAAAGRRRGRAPCSEVARQVTAAARRACRRGAGRFAVGSRSDRAAPTKLPRSAPPSQSRPRRRTQCHRTAPCGAPMRPSTARLRTAPSTTSGLRRSASRFSTAGVSIVTGSPFTAIRIGWPAPFGRRLTTNHLAWVIEHGRMHRAGLDIVDRRKSRGAGRHGHNSGSLLSVVFGDDRRRCLA